MMRAFAVIRKYSCCFGSIDQDATTAVPPAEPQEELVLDVAPKSKEGKGETDGDVTPRLPAGWRVEYVEGEEVTEGGVRMLASEMLQQCAASSFGGEDSSDEE